MKLPAHNNTMTTAALLAVTLGIAACTKVETPAAAADTAAVRLAVMEEGVDTGWPVIAERRHFAIYNTYRALFDDSAKQFGSREQTGEDGLLHVVDSMDSDVAACSIHASLLDD